MTHRTFLLVVCMLWSIQIYAQEILILPDDSIMIDKEQVQQIQKKIDEINAMPLVGDTVTTDNQCDYRVLFFEKQGQLRKYFSQYGGESERGSTTAYYDNNRKLVYIEQEGESNCDDEKEHYYVHDGRIVDFSYYYECGCCEENTLKEEDLPEVRPSINASLVEIRDWGASFIHSDSLLNYLADGYDINGAKSLVLPAIFPRKKPDQFSQSDLLYYESIESMAPIAMLDSIDNPKTYFLQYSPPLGGRVIAVKSGNKYASFQFIPYGIYNEYKIERQNVDGIGNDELIIRRRFKEEGKGNYYAEESGIVVWDLDTYTCLLIIQDKYVYSNWQYDSSGGKIIENSVHNELKVNLNEKRMTIQKVKDGILGLTYIYKLTELGFVLDKVK